MKKTIISIAIALLVVAGAFAGPQYLSLEIGGKAIYNLDSQDVTPSNPFGMQFYFDDSFSAGFTFDSGAGLSLLNLSFLPVEKSTISVYTGKSDGTISSGVATLAYGLGFGFDFFENSDRFFSAVGIELDWFATENTGDYPMEDGGVLSIGLAMKYGI